MNKSTLVLMSGGLDSTALLYMLRRRGDTLHALLIDYGSRHNERERAAAEMICWRAGVDFTKLNLPRRILASALTDPLRPIPEGHYEDPAMKDTVVPFRNGILLSLACGVAASRGIGTVAAGMHAGDRAIYPDCRPEFVNAFSDAALAGCGVNVYTPFLYLTKHEIVRIGVDVGFVPWELTYSCYNGRPRHCGKCGACVERQEAFAIAGVVDPTAYEEPVNV